MWSIILASRHSFYVNFFPKRVISLKVEWLGCFLLIIAFIPGGKGSPISTSLHAKVPFSMTYIISWAKLNIQPPAIAAPLTMQIVGTFRTATLPNMAMNSRMKYLMSYLCLRLLTYFKSKPALNTLSLSDAVTKHAAPYEDSTSSRATWIARTNSWLNEFTFGLFRIKKKISSFFFKMTCFFKSSSVISMCFLKSWSISFIIMMSFNQYKLYVYQCPKK